MNKSIIICSLKHSPGLAKELLVFYEKLNESDNVSILILSRHYKNFFGEKQTIKYLSNGSGFIGMMEDFFFNVFSFVKIINQNFREKNEIIFYNPHPVNPLIQLYFRKKSKISLIIHEPPKTYEELMKHELTLRIYIRIVILFQFLSILLSDRIYLVSPSSFNKFRWKNIFKKKKICQTHLLYKDSKESLEQPKSYFSFVGHIFKGKGFEDFIDLINYAIMNNQLDKNFCIISSSKIDEYIKNLKPGYERILTIINKPNIADEEITEVINKSIAILLLHTVGAQSGILPLCFKQKTPVICRNIGTFNQYVNNNENGILLSENFTPIELYEACSKLMDKNTHSKFSYNGYKTFENYFSEKRFNEFYKDIIE